MRIAACFVCCLVTGHLTAIFADDQPKPGVQVAASLETKVTVDGVETKSPLNYLFFLPAAYGQKEQKWPLLLFLHGAGERGDDLELVKKHGPPKLVEKQKDFQFVVASPQCPAGKRWDAAQLIQLVDHLVAKHQIDASRIYVTGLSMGGGGAWALTAANPLRFAACAPICGGGDVTTAKQLASTPLWVFHGAKDTPASLERSKQMVEAVQAGGGNIKLTVYPEAGHDAWTETYNNPEFYKWLLSHQRKGSK
jgi:predicted peptidase